jgi:uncharacterized membrane protein YcgQ (UPF0703/DUF1980 family)
MVWLNSLSLKLHGVRTLGFALFAVLLFFYAGFPFAAADKNPGLQQGEDQNSESTIFFNGKSYLKINTAELFYLLRKGDSEKINEAFVVRGIVKKSAELERMGRFALLRVNMVCCIADAMAMGVTVSHPNLNELSDGEWVRVFGNMEPLPSEQKLKETPTLDTIPYTMIYDKAVLRADGVEKISRPEAPYMFELPGDTEYHY